eukprot:CAMPEP_0116550170 /NCGR_PEP_ID=MMETSP0397-20121206/5281_1 /TAXON_ID=216820 /ORGANISM="Cyclophora tenuis, Strain ECT3854" /LENGTH=351 /DNA_ID=CAMNT_0004074977 /DNA_START=9 /DNA_END=1064 /DNA_ORIENTATION=-
MFGVIYGMTMFYNHHITPNIDWDSYGSEPSSQHNPHSKQAVGFTANRFIQQGEELFSTYGREDGGKRWFQDRKLVMKIPSPEESKKTGETLIQDKKNYCAKTYAGYGRESWPLQRARRGEHRYLDMNRLTPMDHMSAITTQDIHEGEMIEVAPALVVNRGQAAGTSITPTAIFWDDLWPPQKLSLRKLRSSGDLTVQFQDPSTDWKRIDDFVSFEDVVLLPVAGNIGLVRKVGRENPSSNCKLKLVPTGSMQSYNSHGGGGGSAGILLQLIATRDLAEGEELRLNLPDSSTYEEKKLFVEALSFTGQPLPYHIVDRMEEDEHQQHDHEYQQVHDYEDIDEDHYHYPVDGEL